jgi:hypothetical protein
VNYQRHYDALIQKALNRSKPEGYTEKHHIVPRSMGGSDDPANLVVLTAREHCMAHVLLAKIHGGKMLTAAMFMMDKFKILSSRTYASTREEFIKYKSISMLGDKNIMFGRTHSDEVKKILSESSTKRIGTKSNRYMGPIKATNIDTGEVTIMRGNLDIKAKGFHPVGIQDCLTGRSKTHRNCIIERLAKEVNL